MLAAQTLELLLSNSQKYHSQLSSNSPSPIQSTTAPSSPNISTDNIKPLKMYQSSHYSNNQSNQYQNNSILSSQQQQNQLHHQQLQQQQQHHNQHQQQQGQHQQQQNQLSSIQRDAFLFGDNNNDSIGKAQENGHLMAMNNNNNDNNNDKFFSQEQLSYIHQQDQYRLGFINNTNNTNNNNTNGNENSISGNSNNNNNNNNNSSTNNGSTNMVNTQQLQLPHPFPQSVNPHQNHQIPLPQVQQSNTQSSTRPIQQLHQQPSSQKPPQQQQQQQIPVQNQPQQHSIDENSDKLRCGDCGLMFQGSSDLRKHQKQQHHRQVYKCRKCGELFGSIADRQTHKNNKHFPNITTTVKGTHFIEFPQGTVLKCSRNASGCFECPSQFCTFFTRIPSYWYDHIRNVEHLEVGIDPQKKKKRINKK